MIQISPLRERKEDIIPIAGYYINSFSKTFNIPKLNIAPSARKLLLNHTWPKNVLGLISIVIFVLVSTEGETIYPYNLPDFISSGDPFAMEKVSLERILFSKLMPIIKRMNMDKMEGLHPIVISRVEAPLIKMVLEEMGGNQSKTAKILGINRNTLSKKIKEYNIVV
jgi:two-component system nitrogen regulation response regulator GlnG